MTRDFLYALGAGATLLWAAPVMAAPQSASLQALTQAIGFERLFEVLAEEGAVYGESLEAEMFPQGGGARWQALVGEINRAERLEQSATTRLQAELAGHDAYVQEMTAFFASDMGQRVVGLEIAAREALVDEALREVAEEAHGTLQDTQGARAAQYAELIEVNDLIEQNVAGAMNSNLAFYRGLVQGGGLQNGLSEAEMMADLWSQEPDIRQQTEGWLNAYATLAYGPLSDSDMAAYIAFNASPAGQLLSKALFAAFNETFDRVSYEMGLGAARFVQGQDL